MLRHICPTSLTPPLQWPPWASNGLHWLVVGHSIWHRGHSRVTSFQQRNFLPFAANWHTISSQPIKSHFVTCNWCQNYGGSNGKSKKWNYRKGQRDWEWHDLCPSRLDHFQATKFSHDPTTGLQWALNSIIANTILQTIANWSHVTARGMPGRTIDWNDVRARWSKMADAPVIRHIDDRGQQFKEVSGHQGLQCCWWLQLTFFAAFYQTKASHQQKWVHRMRVQLLLIIWAMTSSADDPNETFGGN